MKIVVLDGYTLNPGDLSWSPLQELGPVEIHDRTPPSLVVPRSEAAEIILTNKTVLTRQQITQLPRLRYIGVLATGFNIVDVAAARQQSVPVTNVPAYGTSSVAQMTFALLLELTQHAGHHASSVRQGQWARSADFCYWERPLVELAGLTLGVVGFGRIGNAVTRIGRALGMRTIAATPHPDPAETEVQFVDLPILLQTADVISLHCPLKPETKQLINARSLAQMKRSALLVNTSRGLLIEEAALAEALNSEGIAGAGLDVLSLEPPLPDNPLLTAKNCYITPHIAWASRAARQRLLDTAVENVRCFLQSSVQNIVN